MELDSDDENLVVGGGGGGLDHHEPQGAEGGVSPQPSLANAVMPPEMYETEWEAFQLSIQRYFWSNPLKASIKANPCPVLLVNPTCWTFKTWAQIPQFSTRRICQTSVFLRLIKPSTAFNESL